MKRGLGSGLSMFLGDSIDIKSHAKSGDRMEISINEIIPNPDQPRKNFQAEPLSELSESIKIYGVLQPIIVVKNEYGKYVIVAGERRYRASKIANLNTIPCIVISDKNNEELYKISLLENIQREDLDPIEEGRSYQILIDRYGYTHDILAKSLGKSRSHVTNMIRLLKLSPEVMDMVSSGKISVGHAKVIAGSEDHNLIANEILDKKMSVRDLESYIKKKNLNIPKHNNLGSDDSLDLNENVNNDTSLFLEIEETLSNLTKSNFRIINFDEKIKMTIDVSSMEKLEELIAIIADGFSKKNNE